MQPEDPITIDGKEYLYADLSTTAKNMMHHVQNVDEKLNKFSAKMELLQIAREGCYARLLDEVTSHEQEQKISATGGIQENANAQ